MSESNNDLVGLGLAALGGFLLGKSFKAEKNEDEDKEIEYLKSERMRLIDERDDLIIENEILSQKDYVSPEDRLYDEDEDEDTEED
tara:strand:+ start:273 stop:530 length:258 start_codon:yes stop_codon:yes gene_type:complete